MHPLKAGLIITNQELTKEVQACLRELPIRVMLQQPAMGDIGALLGQIEQLRLDVLLIDLTRLSEPFEQVMRRLKGLAAPPMVIALNDTADPEVILGAIRAGANEFLYPPLDAGLTKALDRLSQERARQHSAGRQAGKTLAFVSGKGGCGATTIACHVANEMQRATGKEVLLADMDLDSGIIGFLMKAKAPYSVMDAVKNIERLDASYWKALVSNGHGSLDVITAPAPASIREPIDPDHFRLVLRFCRTLYPWTLVDFGRSVNLLSLGMLEDVDELYVVATLDLPSLHQTKQVIQTVLDVGFSRERLHLVMNRMPKRSDFGPGELQKVLGIPVYEMLPNDYPVLYEAYAEGNLLSGNSELSKALSGLATKIAGVAPVKEKPKSKLNLSIF